jgi:copper(I)-binding protein
MSFMAIALAAFTAVVAPAALALEISNAWARATVPGQAVGGVYMELRSDEGARLTGVRSPAAKSAEVHSMSNDGGVMRMRRLDGLDLPAGRTVKLEPGAIHIMLLELKKPLEPGMRFPLELVVEQKGKKRSISVEVKVRK